MIILHYIKIVYREERTDTRVDKRTDRQVYSGNICFAVAIMVLPLYKFPFSLGAGFRVSVNFERVTHKVITRDRFRFTAVQRHATILLRSVTIQHGPIQHNVQNWVAETDCSGVFVFVMSVVYSRCGNLKDIYICICVKWGLTHSHTTVF